MPKTLYLVSCVKTKLPEQAAAKDLYVSDWFRMARAYVEPKGPWLILSAKHGVLEPDEVIDTYEESLNTKGGAERRAWARQVEREILRRTEPGDTVVFLAGEKYRESLTESLAQAGRLVQVPMNRLRSGEQKQWLKQRLEEEGLHAPQRPPRSPEETAARRESRAALRDGRTNIQPAERLEPPHRRASESAPAQAVPTTRIRLLGNAWEQIASRLPDIGSGRLTVTFDEVESWVEGVLPLSARAHQGWWAGQRPAWAGDGWRARPDFPNEAVTFIKE